VLSVRLGPISDVLYKMTDWVKARSKMRLGGRLVRLAGYNRQRSNTVEVLGLGGGKLVLLVVPVGTDPDRAHAVMMTAAAPDNADTVDELLASGHTAR
jgi:hypothetical protein